MSTSVYSLHQFLIVSDSNSVVSVGTVTVVQPIDLESLDPDLIQCSESAIETTLVVKAEDQGNPPQSSTVTLSIIVEVRFDCSALKKSSLS